MLCLTSKLKAQPFATGRTLLLASGLFCLLSTPVSAAEVSKTVSFAVDVRAVLSKAGCNQGTCHGNATGKGGFKLSLRGEDPTFDMNVLARDWFGRRANILRPDDSLLLQKAIAAVPHEGGRRFDTDSPEYHTLRNWIAQGMPRDPQNLPRLSKLEVTPRELVLIDPATSVQLEAWAEFTDGTRRNVTELAVYEASNRLVSLGREGLMERDGLGETTVLVRYLDQQIPVRLAFLPSRPDFAWQAPPPRNYIDEHIFHKLRSLQINPSKLCSDEEFLRRAYLDTLGLLPTVEEVRRFLQDKSSDKRERLVDALVERPEFADYWALKWADLLKIEERVLDRKGVQSLHHWLRESMAHNKPLDQFARELLSTFGSSYEMPASNYYRANRDPTTRGETTAQVFLGIRLQCARCHNHPFDRWTQDDYYSWAALFARVNYRIVGNDRRDRNDKHEFDGEQIVWQMRTGEVDDPRTVLSAPPRLLGVAGKGVKPEGDRLWQMAEWMTDPQKNPQFARMQVNRIWYHLLGRGIVDPIDDFRATNLPANEPLLQALADDLVAHGFDQHHLIRTIMKSATYQLSSQPNETNEVDELNFSRATVRPLSAEQLLDALSQVTGIPQKFNGYPLGMRATQLPGTQAIRSREASPTEGERFLALFGKPARQLACECERSTEPTLNQTFQMISGRLINTLLTQSDNRLKQLLESKQSDAQIVEDLYLSTICRPPSSEELQATLVHLQSNTNRRAALEDVAWSLINAKEFLLRR